MILAVSAVSAADTNDTSDSNLQAVDEAAVDEVASVDVDKLESTDSNDVLSTGGGNFTDLQYTIDTAGVSITLGSNFTRDANEGPIVIEKSIIIDGGGYTIDGNNGGIFEIKNGGFLILRNVILINGNADEGGAIYNEGYLSIADSILSGNNASLGGAVYNNGILEIETSTFENNNAVTDGLSIYNNGNLTLSGNTINGPIVTTGDGLIKSDIIVTVLNNEVKATNEDRYTLRASITDDNGNVIKQIGKNLFNFTVNDLTYEAIYDSQEYIASIVMVPGIYNVNVTYVKNDKLIVYSKENNLINYRGTYTDLQMMIAANTDLVLPYDITYNEIVDADSFPNGVVIDKAITIDGDGYTISGNNTYRIFIVTANNVVLSEVILTKGKATYGGAIYIDNGGNLSTDATFKNNNATYGGAIYTVADLTVDYSDFIDNAATSGAAIYVAGGNLTVDGATFNEDVAVQIDNSVNAEISNSLFTSDEVKAINNFGTLALAGNTVKAIYNGAGGTITSTVKARVLEGSDTLYVEGKNVKLYANITDDNYNPIYQSGFKFVINGNENRDAIFNEATLLYEADYTLPAFGKYSVNLTYTGTAPDLEITNGTITYMTGTFTDLERLINNTSAGETLELPYGFAYDATFDGAKFPNGIVIDKAITIDGKGHSISGNNNHIFYITAANVVLNNITFANTTCQDIWAAIFTNEDLTVVDSTFINNTADHASASGAAIYAYATVTDIHLNIYSSTFTDNTAISNGGGAVCVEGGNYKVIYKIYDSLFENNRALEGTSSSVNAGALWAYSYTEGEINNTRFIRNKALMDDHGNGGAIKLQYGSTLKVSNSIFVENEASKNGGAISIQSISGITTSVIIDTCTFTDNSAPSGAAVVSVHNSGSGSVTIINSNFNEDNAVSLDDDTTATISNSNFTSDKVNAIYNLGTLELAGNRVKSIFNNGTITSQVNATVLENRTYETKENNYTLTAVLTDNDGNLINDTRLKFVVNGVTAPNEPTYDENGVYTYAEYPITMDNGSYIVSVSLDSAPALAVKTGTVKNIRVGTFTDLKEKLDTVNGDLILTYNFTYNEDIDGDLKVIILNKTIDGKGFTISGNGIADVFIVNEDVTIKNTIFADVKDYAIKNNAVLTLTNNTISQDKALIINNGTISNAVVNVLEGQTVSLKFAQTVTLNATFKDTNGNLIKDDRFAFTITNVASPILYETYSNGLYTAEYTADKVELKTVDVTGIGIVSDVTTGKLDISRADVVITINANETIERKQNESIKITLIDEFGNPLSLKLDVYVRNSGGENVKTYPATTDVDGFWSVEVPGLGIDNYTINVIFSGNDNYTSNFTNEKFEVVQLNITNTFTELQELIQANEGTENVLVLPHDFKYNDYVDEDLYAEGVLISKNITIDGNGITIDSDKVYRILNIADGVNVTIKNITFINGNADTGAAILTGADSLTIDSCEFLNSNSSDGGAIYIKGGNVEVIGETLFKNNTAALGGAIFVAIGGNLTVIGAEFDNNTATRGDAVFVGQGAILTLNGTKFTNNGNDNKYTIYNFGTLSLDSSKIEEGKIIFNGGKITNPVYSTVLGNTTYNIVSPTVELTAGLFDKSGNKIYDPEFRFVANGQIAVEPGYNATTGIYNITLDTTTERVYVVNVTSDNEDELITEISIFRNITGTFTELQDLIDNANGNLELPYDFAYVAAVDGDRFPEGVVINELITIDGQGRTISGSNSNRIFRVTADTTLKNVSLVDGNAVEYGGAIMALASTAPLTLNITNVNFTNNMAGNSGAAIAVAGIQAQTVVYNIYDSLFENNVAITTGTVDATGAAISTYGSTKGLINNTIFRGNKAETGEFATGGAIYIQHGGILTVANSTFDSNVANCSGGAISIQVYNNDQTRLTVDNCTFTNNGAEAGSAISSLGYYNSAYVTITKSNFDEDNAVYLDNHTTATISDSIFTSAEKYAIYNLGTLELERNTVKVIFNNGTITTQVNSTVLENKTYNVKTSAYYIQANLVDDNNNKIYDPNFRFVINGELNATAPDYNPTTGVYSFTLDTTTKRVYVVDVTSANEDKLSTKISIVKEITGTFTDLQELINSAAGSFLNLPYNFTYTPEIDDGSFEEGVLISSPVNIDGKGHTIIGNNNERIFNVTAKNVILNNVTLVNGSATNGGAIYVADGGDLTVKAATFENNIATRCAIYVADGGKLNVTGTKFNEDRAIYNNGTASISNSVFTSEEIFAIYNLGNLELSGNKVKLIFNNGTITSTVIATLIGGQTIAAELGDEVSPNATLTDDNLNPIYDARFNITVRDNELETAYDVLTNLYYAEYKYKIVNAGDNIVSTNYPATTINTGLYDVPKANVTNFTIDVIPTEVPYRGNATAIITLLGVDGEELDVTQMIVVVNNTEFPVKIVKGTGSFNITGLDPGNYAAVAMFNGNDNYNSAYATDVFDVLEQDIVLSVEVEDIYFGNTANVNITLTFADGSSAVGKVSIEVNGLEIIVNVDGNKSVGFVDLPVGKHNVTAILLHDGLYDEVVNDTEVIEVFDSPDVTVTANANETITYGDDLTVDIGQIISKGTNATITGNATINIYNRDGSTAVPVRTIEINVTQEGATVDNIAGLDVGSYKIVVDFDSVDGYYHGQAINYTTVTKAEVRKFIIDTTDAVYGNHAVINITIKGVNDENLNGTLYITLNDERYEPGVTMTDGNYVSYVPANYSVNTYTANVYFVEANGNYENASAYGAFEITKATPTIVVGNASPEWGVPFQIPVKLIGVDDTPIVGTVNVKITWIEGVAYSTVNLNESGEGVANFTFDGPIGEWYITASFDGNDNYTDAIGTATLNVTECMTPVLEVVADSTVPYNEIVYVNVTLSNLRGAPIANVNITYTVDGGKAQNMVTDNSGFVSIPIDDLAGGEHTITVSFNNESYHTYPSDDVTVTVTPIEPSIFDSEASKDNVYGDTVTISVYAPGLIGNVSLTIDNEVFNPGEDLKDGIYIFNVTDLAAGTHSYVVTFNGNENFTVKSSSNSFVVDKATPFLDVNDTEVVYAETDVIPFAVIGVNGQYVDGSVYAVIQGVEEFAVIEYLPDGTGSITFRKLATGSKLITVKFASDNDNYTNVVKDIYLNVTQATITDLDSSNEMNFTYRESVNITVYVEGLVGDDTIEVILNVTDSDGATVVKNSFIVSDGEVITISDILPVGEYRYDIIFAGDKTYVPGQKGNITSGSFHIDLINITGVEVDGSQITYGENGTITVSNLPEDAKGNITVTLIDIYDNFTADVIGGVAVVEIPGLNGSKTYYVDTIVYSGDEIYAPFIIDDAKDVAIDVAKAPSLVIVSLVNDTTHLGNTSFDLTVYNATTVHVAVVNLDTGLFYYENITNIPEDGIVQKTIELTDIPAGSYRVMVLNIPTNNYMTGFDYSDFVSERIDPEMETSITPDIKVEDEGVQISITLPVDANGTVSVLIDGNVISLGGKQTGGNVVVNVSADKLTSGSHSYTVQFSGDTYYTKSEVTVPFNVTKIDQPVSVIVDEEEIGFMGSPVVNISVASDATGEIVIDINNMKLIYDNLGENGNYTIQLVDLQAGEFYLNVTYLGDRKYNKANNYTTFTVPKAVATVNITNATSFIRYGEDVTFTVTMSNDLASGNVTIYINGVENKTVILDDEYANASVAISGMAVDHYVIGVKYNGNDNFFESNIVEFMVTVDKAYSSVTIDEIKNETYGIDVVINYGVVNRTNVTVRFAIYDGAAFINVNASNELYEDHIVVHDLVPGLYLVYINNNETESYFGYEASSPFVVNQAEPVINITAETAYYTSDVNVSYSIDPAFLGYEIFVFDENGTQVNFTAADNTVFLSNLITGYYTVAINVFNTQNYTSGYNDVTFYVSIVDIGGLENSSDTVFSINLPEDAGGMLLVDINGQQYYAIVKNGTASIAVPQLVPGNYTANVTYTGDGKYPSISATQNITVESNLPENALTIPDSGKSDAPTTYSISLPNDAKGFLEVDVDGKKYAASLNGGSASVSIPAQSEGTHNITVTYTGDTKYSPAVKETSLTVTAPVFKITSNKNVAAVYSAKATYKVLVLREGKAVGSGQTVTFNFNGKTYTANTDSKGYATLTLNTKVKVGKYTITATYKGVTVKNTVTIKQLIKAKNAKIKKSKKINKIRVKTYKVNGKYLKGKKLKLKITLAPKSKKSSAKSSSSSSASSSSSSSAKTSTGKAKYITAKINKKGVAIFKLKQKNIKKLKVGKKYQYTVVYGKDTITKKLTVKK
jgi:predicted outer membrane repeat protein